MKKSKKIIAFLLTLCMVFSLGVTVFAAETNLTVKADSEVWRLLYPYCVFK